MLLQKINSNTCWNATIIQKDTTNSNDYRKKRKQTKFNKTQEPSGSFQKMTITFENNYIFIYTYFPYLALPGLHHWPSLPLGTVLSILCPSRLRLENVSPLRQKINHQFLVFGGVSSEISLSFYFWK